MEVHLWQIPRFSSGLAMRPCNQVQPVLAVSEDFHTPPRKSVSGVEPA